MSTQAYPAMHVISIRKLNEHLESIWFACILYWLIFVHSSLLNTICDKYLPSQISVSPLIEQYWKINKRFASI